MFQDIIFFLLSLFIQESETLNIPDTVSYSIIAPAEVNIKEHIDYPIFFVSNINNMDEPEDKPPEDGLVVLYEEKTGKSNMIIFDNKEIKPPYLIKKKDKRGKTIYKYIYLWYQIDLNLFCEREGTYQIFVISNRVRSNLINFEVYGVGEEAFFNSYAFIPKK